MPISIKEFDKKGTAPTRASGFGGVITSKAMELLNSEKSAFSLDEVATATESNMEDDTDNKTLMNVLYVLRSASFNKAGTQTRDARITLKAVDGVKHYRIATAEEIEEQKKIAHEKYEAKLLEAEDEGKTPAPEDEEEDAPEDEEEE